jgi:hypothetical protein
MDFSDLSSIGTVTLVETEETRARILASMLPYLGIYLAKKYDHPLMRESRIVGSFFVVLFILSLLIGGSEGFLTFIVTSLYIILFVVEGVSLFVYGRWFSWRGLSSLPSYTEIEAHIVASVRSLIEFFRIVF